MPAKTSQPFRSRLKHVKLFLCDVDGVLTDGSVFIGGAREIKRFNIRDGLGLVFPGRLPGRLGLGAAVGGDETARGRIAN
jgi:3-deoxy-D-manno-octulosonate 8-phosphate phosphatase (KDO 8-P phosphatase)